MWTTLAPLWVSVGIAAPDFLPRSLSRQGSDE
jgi:hypothetical protein